MPELILKLTGDDFERGLSLQRGKAVGGLWQQMTNYDPFQKFGQLYPTLGPTRKDGGSIAVAIKAFDFYSDGTNRFLFGIGDEDGSGNCAYKINLDTDAITNISTNFHSNAADAQDSSMLRIYQGRVLYDQQGGGQSIRSVTVAGASDTAVLNGLSASHAHPSVVGPDGYLYIGNGQYIAQVITATTTAGNGTSKFDSLQTDLICRDIDHDGHFIVAGFDNNTDTPLSGIKADCQIIFWDRYKSYAEKRYPIPEAYIIGVRCLGSTTLIWTPGGIYECSVVTPPYLKYPFTSEAPFNALPANYNGISKDGHSVYWIDSAAGVKQVYAIGQKVAGRPRVVYNPYEAGNLGGASITQTALIVSGSYIYAATSDPAMYKLNSATGKTAVAKPTPKYLPRPYTFSYTKVKLKSAMVSGDEVTHVLYNSDDEIISGSETLAYSNQPGLKTLTFTRNGSGGATIHDFTDVVPYITTNVEIAEVEVYGDPVAGIHSRQK